MYTCRVYDGDRADPMAEREGEMSVHSTLADAMAALMLTVEEYAGDGFTSATFHNRVEVRGDNGVLFVSVRDGVDDDGVCPVYAEVRAE